MSNPYQNSQNGYQQNNSYELNNYPNKQYSSSNEDDFVQFMNEIQDINSQLDNYSNIINLIDNKQKNFLHGLDLNDEDTDYDSKQIENLVNEAQSLQLDLKNRIKNVQTQAVHSRDQTKVDQAETCRKRFLDLIQDYRLVEARNKESTKEQAARQYQIIKPDATDEEIKAVVEDGSQQYFQQALMQSNRRGEARSVLNEVQVRHRELLKLEKTMAELTQLFHDMEELVIEQDQPIQQIEEQVGTAQHDIEQGVGHTNKAVKSAKSARKKKLWCFFICLLIVIILAVILGAYFGTRK
ncbi:syntaxin 1B/2/3 [Candida albicans P57072]|uniref:Protein transport protein SSO2 n=3 Tax=Candida albicans TaxID=5476 RepID=SSO2_CANAL|nr:syntaxin [Candida albicans SC5314]Q59YF0.1 RecName: Full=Protein transport protein SSO2 [Candida albicans SC5314]EEQ47470.1 protein SSO2 [Candida albicans WO-1]KGQ89495.1 syntaxin 1B/2/3 [Candida albicans P94015]KGQ95959.1 syntaxin 1B/2/3 [Candida albicans P37005]KGR00557.1 syntaxin 1B/2/3 [Candida albicans GC75]KGR11809.1 syntaxin 1B/2/3 [Candida albicans P57072]KGR13944.1 syntaxin 1B/2/3 [Candida albicans P78048]KGR20782.1 syntaxin 1B/2/3 [Candida albicans P37037]KGT70344.1 syntaxin 1|eukprot:XP_714550.1 syntaxin [Candida albicans SC5314]